MPGAVKQALTTLMFTFISCKLISSVHCSLKAWTHLMNLLFQHVQWVLSLSTFMHNPMKVTKFSCSPPENAFSVLLWELILRCASSVLVAFLDVRWSAGLHGGKGNCVKGNQGREMLVTNSKRNKKLSIVILKSFSQLYFGHYMRRNAESWKETDENSLHVCTHTLKSLHL